jgi:preprotein translocase subunit SecA
MNTIFEKLKDENEGRDFSKIEKIYNDIMRVCDENKNLKDIIISEKIKELKKYKTFNKEFYIKFISILISVCEIKFNYKPREIQIISLLLFIFKNKEQGIIEQIYTGEGKSLIITLLATVKAFIGYKVDILTSSLVLAERDANEMKGFYNMFELTVDYCRRDSKINEKNNCYEFYNADIVYGDTLSFEGDILRTNFMDKVGRGNKREFGCIIIDEIDNICLDNIKNMTEIIDNFKGYKYLDYYYYVIYEELIKIVKAKEKEKKEIIDELSEAFEKEIKINGPKIEIEKHILEEFVPKKLNKWFDSAFDARFNYKLNKDYIITEDKELGFKVIKPIDYSNTGVIEEDSVWTGLHQFLQLKEHLRITEENLSSCYMSNLTFFKKYIKNKNDNECNYNSSDIIENNIYGLSGTLGSKKSQEALKSLYNLDLVFIPSFKDRQLIYKKENNMILKKSSNTGEYSDKLKEIIKRIAIDEKRAVLIIFKYIDEVNKKKSSLENDKELKKNIKIISYTRSDKKAEKEFLKNKIDSGTVILSTNLSGRGTDIKLTDNVINNGGLHVILTFMPKSERIEKQAFGRAARKGEKGSAQYFIESEDNFDALLKQRDEKEENEYKYLTLVYQKKVFLFEKFFDKISEKIKIIRGKEMKNKKMKNSIIKDIKERWALFLVKNDLSNIEKYYKDEDSLKFSEAEFNEIKNNFQIFINKIDEDIQNLDNYSFTNKLYSVEFNDINYINEMLKENKNEDKGYLEKEKSINEYINNYELTSNIGIGLRVVYNLLFSDNKSNDNKKIIKNIFADLRKQCKRLYVQIKNIPDYFGNILEANIETDLKKQFEEKKKYLEFLIGILDENIKKLEDNKKKNLLPTIIDIKKEKISRDILHYFHDLGIIYFKLEECKEDSCFIF